MRSLSELIFTYNRTENNLIEGLADLSLILSQFFEFNCSALIQLYTKMIESRASSTLVRDWDIIISSTRDSFNVCTEKCRVRMQCVYANGLTLNFLLLQLSSFVF